MKMLNVMLLLCSAFMAKNSYSLAVSALPPIHFIASIDAENILKQLKEAPLLAKLDKEIYGSPIKLRVTHSYRPTAGGTAAGLTSAMLSGGTLGLLPLITNNDMVLTYELLIQSKVIAQFSYHNNFTQAKSIYANNLEAKIDKQTRDWINVATRQFVQDLANSKETAQLSQEYQYYFGRD